MCAKIGKVLTVGYLVVLLVPMVAIYTSDVLAPRSPDHVEKCNILPQVLEVRAAISLSLSLSLSLSVSLSAG